MSVSPLMQEAIKLQRMPPTHVYSEAERRTIDDAITEVAWGSKPEVAKAIQRRENEIDAGYRKQRLTDVHSFIAHARLGRKPGSLFHRDVILAALDTVFPDTNCLPFVECTQRRLGSDAEILTDGYLENVLGLVAYQLEDDLLPAAWRRFIPIPDADALDDDDVIDDEYLEMQELIALKTAPIPRRGRGGYSYGYHVDVAEKIVAVMTRNANLTQDDVAKLIGRSQGYVSRMVNWHLDGFSGGSPW